MKYHLVVNSIEKSSVSTSSSCVYLLHPHLYTFYILQKTITFCWQNEQETNKIQAFSDNSMNVL